MASNYLTTGIKINVDATDFDTKFAKTAEQLNRTLTKSQKALGLQYDANQRLVNSQGQVVEGLSQAQIKLGQYVDELGNVRTYQDGFAAGLSRSEQELGFFADELGNVYNRMGALVRESDAVKRATAETAGHFTASRDAIGDLGSQFANVFSNLAGAGDEASKFALAMTSIGEGIATTVDVAKYTGELAEGLRGVSGAATTAGAGAKSLGLSFAAMAGPGGWVALGIGAIAGLTVGLTTFFSKTQKSETIVDELGISFEELRRRAKAAGDEIENVSDILAAANSASLSGLADEQRLIQQIVWLQKYRETLPDGYQWFSPPHETSRLPDDVDQYFNTDEKSPLYFATKKTVDQLIDNCVDSLAQWLLQIEAGFVTEEEKLQEQIKIIDLIIEQERSRGATEARISEIAETREKVAAKLREAQERESQAADQKARTEAERAVEAQRKLVEERRRQIRDSINFGGLEGAISAAQQENLTFSPETFVQDEARLWDLVNQGIYDSAEASAIISAAWQRNAQAASEAAKAAEEAAKAAEEAAKIAKDKAAADKAAAERDALQSWGYAALQKAAEGPVSELLQMGKTYAKINADAKKMPDLQDEASVALLGVEAALAGYYDKIARAASATALDGRGHDALNNAQNELAKALKEGKISNDYYNKATEALADARVRETQRVQQARRNENKKQEDAQKAAAEREKMSAMERRRKEAADYLDSLKTPWEKYLEQVAEYDKDFRNGIIEDRDQLNTLKNKAWSEYVAQTQVPGGLASQEDEWSRKTTAAVERQAAGTASAKAGSAELYKMQLAQSVDRQAQMLASLDNTQIIVRDSFSMLNNLVLSIRQNLANNVDNRQAAVFRGLAAQTIRNYGG